MSNQYVHYFSATKDFIHEGKLEENQQHIVATVQACPESLFIFDEMDKMPSGIMDVVKPFLEYNQPVEGTDYRSSIFLFLRGPMKINPKRPLVRSFYGMPGTVLNFVSSLITEHIYAKGMSSHYVLYFSATKDFIHEDKLRENQTPGRTAIWLGAVLFLRISHFNSGKKTAETCIRDVDNDVVK
ncbi:TOR2X-like protein [Mya arenaria]|uniref:TOR2X-like protein n=1 Tax=Mya arenaria TaxID=6604 RepID=A0ABY7DPE0_MYAAR|nr:TOR2X-like protein [Mya arenaria]